MFIVLVFCLPKEFYLGNPGDWEGLHIKYGVGPLAGEAWLVLATQDLMGQCEVDLGVVKLLDSWSAALVLTVVSSTFMICVQYALLLLLLSCFSRVRLCATP